MICIDALPRKQTHVDILDGLKNVIFSADLNHMDKTGKPLCLYPFILYFSIIFLLSLILSTRYDFIILDNIKECSEYNDIDSSLIESKMVFILYDDCKDDIFKILSILEEKLAVGIILIAKDDELYKENFKKSQLKNRAKIPVGKIHYNQFIELNENVKKVKSAEENVHQLKLRYMSLECMPFENLLV